MSIRLYSSTLFGATTGDSKSSSFDELLKEYMDEYEPVGPGECGLVHRMVVSKWREQRAWTVETAAFRSQMEPEQSDPAASLSATFASFTVQAFPVP